MSVEFTWPARDFQVWEYSVGHSQLLLRSTKCPGAPTRIDVLFKPVSVFHLPTLLHGLTISTASVEELAAISPSPDHLKDRTLFVVRTADFVGYVIASIVRSHEDEGEYFDPSQFRLRP